MTTEFVLHPPHDMPPPSMIERLEHLQASLVSDVFDRWSGAVGLGPIAGLRPGQVVAGAAFTVRTRPGDNLVVHKSLDLVRPGEVLVVAAGGHVDRAIIGGLMGQYATKQGVAALVIDGAVRDRSDLDDSAPPVFAAGLCHLGPYKDGPGELRGPVSVGGIVVHDGDLIIGDEDGIAVIPRDRAADVIAAAEAKQAAELKESQAIAAGTWDRRWLDDLLMSPPDGAAVTSSI